MRILLILLISLVSISCAGKQEGSITRTPKGAKYLGEGKGIVEIEFYPDGTVKRVKTDNKAEPLIKLPTIDYKKEE